MCAANWWPLVQGMMLMHRANLREATLARPGRALRVLARNCRGSQNTQDKYRLYSHLILSHTRGEFFATKKAPKVYQELSQRAVP